MDLYMNEEELKECSKIHGYISEEGSDSESNLTFEEMCQIYKPPPIEIDPSRHEIIEIGPFESAPNFMNKSYAEILKLNQNESEARQEPTVSVPDNQPEKVTKKKKRNRNKKKKANESLSTIDAANNSKSVAGCEYWNFSEDNNDSVYYKLNAPEDCGKENVSVFSSETVDASQNPKADEDVTTTSLPKIEKCVKVIDVQYSYLNLNNLKFGDVDEMMLKGDADVFHQFINNAQTQENVRSTPRNEVQDNITVRTVIDNQDDALRQKEDIPKVVSLDIQQTAVTVSDLTQEDNENKVICFKKKSTKNTVKLGSGEMRVTTSNNLQEDVADINSGQEEENVTKITHSDTSKATTEMNTGKKENVSVSTSAKKMPKKNKNEERRESQQLNISDNHQREVPRTNRIPFNLDNSLDISKDTKVIEEIFSNLHEFIKKFPTNSFSTFINMQYYHETFKRMGVRQLKCISCIIDIINNIAILFETFTEKAKTKELFTISAKDFFFDVGTIILETVVVDDTEVDFSEDLNFIENLVLSHLKNFLYNFMQVIIKECAVLTGEIYPNPFYKTVVNSAYSDMTELLEMAKIIKIQRVFQNQSSNFLDMRQYNVSNMQEGEVLPVSTNLVRLRSNKKKKKKDKQSQLSPIINDILKNDDDSNKKCREDETISRKSLSEATEQCRSNIDELNQTQLQSFVTDDLDQSSKPLNNQGSENKIICDSNKTVENPVSCDDLTQKKAIPSIKFPLVYLQESCDVDYIILAIILVLLFMDYIIFMECLLVVFWYADVLFFICVLLYLCIYFVITF